MKCYDLINLIVQIFVAIGTIAVACFAYIEMREARKIRQKEKAKRDKVACLQGRRIWNELSLNNQNKISRNLSSYLNEIDTVHIEKPEIAYYLRQMANKLRDLQLIKNLLTNRDKEDPVTQSLLKQQSTLLTSFGESRDKANQLLMTEESNSFEMQKIFEHLQSVQEKIKEKNNG